MRINLYGGPGSGKSTVASKIFSSLKEQHILIELVNEFVKTMAYQGIVATDWDQLTIFSSQLAREEVFLKNGVKHIVTDSPILLVACYTKLKFPRLFPHLIDMSAAFREMYQSIDIFIKRPEVYQAVGRYEDIEAAKRMDDIILEVLSDTVPDFKIVDCNDFNTILSLSSEAVQPHRHLI